MSGGNTRKKAADHPYRDFGADLGRLRYNAHVTQEAVAKYVAVSAMTVRNWESGRFKPTVRNLQQVIEFYVERDTDPGKWYSRDAAGRVQKYNDLPLAYQANLNTDPPFGRHPRATPALDDTEIEDVIAFLRTLTDGFKPNEGRRWPAPRSAKAWVRARLHLNRR